MAKSKDVKKEVKKEAAKTPKEKKEEKRNKKPKYDQCLLFERIFSRSNTIELISKQYMQHYANVYINACQLIATYL